MRIADFGFKNQAFPFRIPHSALRIPQSADVAPDGANTNSVKNETRESCKKEMHKFCIFEPPYH